MKTILFVGFPFILFSCSNHQGGKDASNKDSVEVATKKVLTPEDIYNQSSDKVAMVLCYQGGLPSSQGSGFFIDKNTLVTNYHVIEGADRVELKIAGKEDIIKSAKVIKAAPEYDIAIIQTKQDFKALPIDSTSNYKVGSSKTFIL